MFETPFACSSTLSPRDGTPLAGDNPIPVDAESKSESVVCDSNTGHVIQQHDVL